MEIWAVSACFLNMDCFGEHQSFLNWSFNIRVSSLSLLIVIYLGHNGVFLLPWLFYCPYFIASHRGQIFLSTGMLEEIGIALLFRVGFGHGIV